MRVLDGIGETAESPQRRKRDAASAEHASEFDPIKEADEIAERLKRETKACVAESRKLIEASKRKRYP
jgi:hypothetical protein